MIVLDASVLISYWGTPDTHSDDAFAILDTEQGLVIHPVTLAESLVGLVRIGREGEALEELLRLGVERHSPMTEEPVEIARLRASTSVKTPDCCVLVTAVALDATLATVDRRLAEVARSRGVAVAGP